MRPSLMAAVKRMPGFTSSTLAIRLPFSSLAGVGEAAAVSLREARDTGGEYISIDDLQARSKVSSAVIDTLREAGSLSSLPESSQTTLF